MTLARLTMALRIAYYDQIALPEDKRNYEEYRRLLKELKEQYNRDSPFNIEKYEEVRLN